MDCWGKAIVVGSTSSNDLPFPIPPRNPVQGQKWGKDDAFIAMINRFGSSQATASASSQAGGSATATLDIPPASLTAGAGETETEIARGTQTAASKATLTAQARLSRTPTRVPSGTRQPTATREPSPTVTATPSATPTEVPFCEPTGNTIKGDDTYQVEIIGKCTGNLKAPINIDRYYGPLADAGAETGKIDPTVISTTVEAYATLKIEVSDAAGQTFLTSFAGQSCDFTPFSNAHTESCRIAVNELIFPRKGSITRDGSGNITSASAPPDALNQIIITHNTPPNAKPGKIEKVTLDLKGMRPLVLAAGFNFSESTPAHYQWPTDGTTPCQDGKPTCLPYFTWPWDPATSEMLFRPNRDGHASIYRGGETLAQEVRGAMTMFGVPRVNIIGHSMGALWSREFALRYDQHDNSLPSSIDRLMMLGTPNGGSSWADTAGNLRQRGYTKPALNHLRKDFMLSQYNPSHGPVLGVTYVDLAGIAQGFPVRGDQVVSVDSVQKLPYSTHLAPITKPMPPPIDKKIVHQLQPKAAAPNGVPYTDFRDALRRCFVLTGDCYGATPVTNLSVTAPEPVYINSYPSIYGTLRAGQVQTGTIIVDNNVQSVSFRLNWANEDAELVITVRDPQGTLIDAASTYPNLTVSWDGAGIKYLIKTPLAGQWEVSVRAITTPPNGEQFDVSGEFDEERSLLAQRETADLTIVPNLSTQLGPLNEPLSISATVGDGNPIANAILTATIAQFREGSYSSIVIPLVNQGSGLYQASFTPTMEGQYDVTILATGRNSAGQPFRRQVSTLFTASSAAMLQPTYREEAVDGNSNGLYDRLLITATTTISEAGRYQLSGYLAKLDGAGLGYSSVQVNLVPGSRAITLAFDGVEIGRAGADGPYQLRSLYFSRIVSDEIGLALIPVAYTTTAYSRYAWERSNGVLTGPTTEHAVDTNGNGLYDYLAVTTTLDLRTAGSYTASLNLLTADKRMVAAANLPNLSLVQGRNQVVVRFEGGQIRASGLDGPYRVGDLVLWSRQPDSSVAEVLSATAAYRANQFEVALPTTTPTVATATPTRTSSPTSTPTGSPALGAPYVVSGTITYHGELVAGAVVEVLATTPLVTVTTNASGYYSLTVPSGLYNLRATFSSPCAQTSVGTVNGPPSQTFNFALQPTHDNFGYTCEDRTAYPIVPASVALDFSSTSGNITLALPFNFHFYGGSYSTINVNRHGNVQFPDSNNSMPGGWRIPNWPAYPFSSLPHNAIHAYWSNLSLETGGRVYYTSSGTAPYRRFLVEWRNVPHGAGGSTSFEIVLEESTSRIFLNYGQIDHPNYGMVAYGIENWNSTGWISYGLLGGTANNR